MNAHLPWWLRHGHTQTLAALASQPDECVASSQQCLETADGDFVNLTWFDHQTGPIFILLPGMGGHARSPYIQVIANHLWKAGFSSVVLEGRGARQPNRLAKFYHAGFTEDIDWLSARLYASNRPVYAIGFSLGANVLVKWLAQAQEHSRIKAAAMVSMTFDLSSTATLANRGFNRIYQARVLSGHLRVARAKLHLPEYQRRREHLAHTKTMADFDDRFTAPLNGFGSAQAYYGYASSAQFLPYIPVPCVVLNAADDPLISPSSWPNSTELPPHIELLKVPHGGHLGFMARWRKSYFPDQLTAFFKTKVQT